MSATIQKKTYTVVITTDKDDGRFVGWCDDLHACSYGITFGELVEKMKEAMKLAALEFGMEDEFNMLITEK